MSDTSKLIVVPLEEATPEQREQFFDLVARQRADAELQRDHRCWFFVPSPTEWERMKKYAEPPDYDKCPKCGEGRVVVEIFRDSMGACWTLKCRRGSNGCDFSVHVSDD